MKLNRSHKRPLEYTIGRADRDPMFTPAWYDGTEPLTPPTKPAQEPSPHWDLAPLPPLSQTQHNDHVMRYWDWRLDRLVLSCEIAAPRL